MGILATVMTHGRVPLSCGGTRVVNEQDLAVVRAEIGAVECAADFALAIFDWTSVGLGAGPTTRPPLHTKALVECLAYWDVFLLGSIVVLRCPAFGPEVAGTHF